jgi:predicted Abi (CAAX) family protease
MPPVVRRGDGLANSLAPGIERSPLNEDGWYVYGALDERGTFLVAALAPRALLRVPSNAPTERYARERAWHDVIEAKGGIVSAGPDSWRRGDCGLVIHTYGGVRSAGKTPAWLDRFAVGHFAYGIARVVEDPLCGDLRFDITYHQLRCHDTEGTISGKMDWARYLGDRQYGWSGLRPVCDAILKLDAFTTTFDIDVDHRAGALDALAAQLEVMGARYRIGDGNGGTFATFSSNSAQDSNRALFATLESIDRFVKTHPAIATWPQTHPGQAARYDRLRALLEDLRKRLQPFGNARSDWSQNEYNLGATLEDAPIGNLMTALGSWRCLLPRLAFNTIADAFVRHGATATILGCDQIGGDRSDIVPIAPLTL